MTTPDARLARVETLLADIREDVSELRDEAKSARQRLHNLEGIATAVTATQKANRHAEELQYHQLGRRVQFIGLLLAAAAVISPLIAVFLKAH